MSLLASWYASQHILNWSPSPEIERESCAIKGIQSKNTFKCMAAGLHVADICVAAAGLYVVI